MSTITEVKTMDEWEKRVSSLPSTTFHIIYFFASWAAPCENIARVLTTLAAEYPVTDPPTTCWTSVDADEMDDLTDLYKVSVVPFIVITRGGQVLQTVSGSSTVNATTVIKKHVDQGGAATDAATANGVAKPEVVVPAAAPAPPAEEKDPETSTKELRERLENLVKAASVMLFMKGTPSEPKCGFSRQIVGILREHSVKYGFFNILADDDVRQGLKEFADWPTYPQLWINGELVGGLDIVKEELANDPDFLKPYAAGAEAAAGS